MDAQIRTELTIPLNLHGFSTVGRVLPFDRRWYGCSECLTGDVLGSERYLAAKAHRGAHTLDAAALRQGT